MWDQILLLEQKHFGHLWQIRRHGLEIIPSTQSQKLSLIINWQGSTPGTERHGALWSVYFCPLSLKSPASNEARWRLILALFLNTPVFIPSQEISLRRKHHLVRCVLCLCFTLSSARSFFSRFPWISQQIDHRKSRSHRWGTLRPNTMIDSPKKKMSCA